MRQTDADFMLSVLSETPEEWVPAMVILRRSFEDRGVGLTIHSRAATLRERGHIIECRVDRAEEMRAISYYRIVERNGTALVTPLAEGESRPGESGVGAPLAGLSGGSPSASGEGLARPEVERLRARLHGPSRYESEAEGPAPLFLYDDDDPKRRRPAWA
jgi:hypothetical protein